MKGYIVEASLDAEEEYRSTQIFLTVDLDKEWVNWSGEKDYLTFNLTEAKDLVDAMQRLIRQIEEEAGDHLP